MISKKYIKELEFETIEDLYGYVVESENNGAIKQTKELVKKMNATQFLGFINYLRDYNKEDMTRKFFIMRCTNE